MNKKTVVVVAHRLSTLLSMDRILVFDQEFQHLSGKNKRCPANLYGRDIKDIARTEKEGLKKGDYTYIATAPSGGLGAYATYKVLADDDQTTFKKSVLMGATSQGHPKTLCTYAIQTSHPYLKIAEIISIYAVKESAPDIAVHEEKSEIVETQVSENTNEGKETQPSPTVAFTHPFMPPHQRFVQGCLLKMLSS
ncbi:hypothetical protein AWC38_SpisGene25073 [Stylophora pistillata]|uniref:Uncharacterized protein n=1 Tax=Stylophora pistillata TaxID=50429 RepID=A0A2B4R3B6_STYPI|nr:hypothetical protein AWC38_SpisGene25073 [Stylophora pistillata]